MTGNATLNLANIQGVGIFELSFGKDGLSSRLGMGGTDVSLGTIGSAMRGAQHWGVNNRIEDAALANDMDVATALRTQYGFGDDAAQVQLQGILDGKTKLVAEVEPEPQIGVITDTQVRLRILF